jgi:hypothetical protein
MAIIVKWYDSILNWVDLKKGVFGIWVVRKLLREEPTIKPKRFKFIQHLKKHNFTKRRNGMDVSMRSLSGGATSMPYLMNWDGMLRSGLREQQMLHRMEIERQQRLRQMERSSELYLAMLEQRRLMDSYNGPSKSF